MAAIHHAQPLNKDVNNMISYREYRNMYCGKQVNKR